MLITKQLLLLLLIFFLPYHFANAEVYRWKDKNGKLHFSDKPHADATQYDINAPKSAGIGLSKKQSQRRKELLESFQEKNEARQEQALKDKKQLAAIDSYCNNLKNQLRDYQEVDYLYTRDKSGIKNNLSEQQKQKEEQKLQKLLDERC